MHTVEIFIYKINIELCCTLLCRCAVDLPRAVDLQLDPNDQVSVIRMYNIL